MSDQPAASVIESRSFDYVPESERQGTIRGQFQFWFMINATLITAFSGAVGALFGLGLVGSLVAIVAGSITGTLFQAFHGAQGPRMGLPQMIQSRVQFGSRGAIIPIAAATIVPLGFAIFYFQTGASSLSGVVALNPTAAQIVVGIAAILLAIFGFRLLLKVERFASYFMLANLVLLTIAVVAVAPIGDLLATSAWAIVPFLAQFGASAGYQIAIAPIVSDYTRYLPSRTSGRRVSAAVFAGTILSAVWIESIGAVVALARPETDVITGILDIGNEFGFAIGTITMVIAVVSCLAAGAVSLYSGTISFLSALEAFRPLRSTARLRAVTIGTAGACVVIAAATLPADILANFSVFLLLLGYLLIPWTAVNLTDYYLVRRGAYSISDIVRPDGGIYGRWNAAGILSYAVGFVVMIPFFSTTLYTGPVAAALGGADLSFVVGLVVASVLYLFLTRRLDLSAERRLVQDADINTLTTAEVLV